MGGESGSTAHFRVRFWLKRALGAVLVAALCSGAAAAAEKAFQRAALADAAIRLAADLREEAGTPAKPVAALRRDADAAVAKKDFRAAAALLGQVVTAAPNDSAAWLSLSRAFAQSPAKDNAERATLQDRASTAAYLGYQRARNPAEEADSLAVLGRALATQKVWRPALDAMRFALDLREVPALRAEYEKAREDHGFRLLDYAVDSDAASPRVCFQFSEKLAPRTDFSPFVTMIGTDRPALSTDDKQLCVDGLKHGERYSLALRAGLPSAVRETLAKPAEFTIYVRDRKPFVHFTSKAYVLPRAGQQGIPLVSVNTASVAVEVYRVGDRNLIQTVIDGNFQENLYPYQLQELAEQKGRKIWSGTLAVESKLNADVTTAFPVEEAIGALSPGVYVMSAGAKKAEDEDGPLATQWFVVSDLGVTAYSGTDGIHVFVHALGSARPVAKAEVRLLARNNEVLATKTTDEAGHVQFEAALARGPGGQAPAMLTVSGPEADYAFLNLKNQAFDLTDRGVDGRAPPGPLDAFVYAERGVYRTGETLHLTTLLRDARGAAVSDLPLTAVIQRPDGLDYRRVTLKDGGLGGYALDVALSPAAPHGTWRARIFADPKGEAIGETSFLVEDYVPDRIAFEVTTAAKEIAKDKPVTVKVDGRFLYGAPGAGLALEGDLSVGVADERPGFAGYRFGVATDEDADNSADDEASDADGDAPSQQSVMESLEDLPATDDKGHAEFPVTVSKLPQTTQPLEATITLRLAEPGGRSVEHEVTLPVTPARPMIGVKPLFTGALSEGQPAAFDVVWALPDGKTAAKPGLRYELLRIETNYQWYRRGGNWQFEPVKKTSRVADGALDVAAAAPARLSLPTTNGHYRLEVSDGSVDGALTTVFFDVGWYSDGGADTPDALEIALDKPEYATGDTLTVSATARMAGRLTIDVIGDRLIQSTSVDVQPGQARVPLTIGADWGAGAYIVATLRRPLDVAAQRMPGRAIGVAWFSVDRQARTLSVDLAAPALVRPNAPLTLPVKIAGLARGESARVVAAAVDVGILNLTGYEAPRPDAHYFGQRALSAEIRDLYGQLIDGMQGARGAIRSGGDDEGGGMKGSPPAQKPLALYSGIVTVGDDGAATIRFDMPDFAGTARVMAVAWSAGKVGAARADVTVRDPVVVTATLPRFLLVGDRSTLHVAIDNVDGQAGAYTVSVESDGPVQVANAKQTLTLAAKQRGALTLPLTGASAGVATVKIALDGPGLSLTRSYALGVNAATPVVARRTVRTLAKGESLTLSRDLFGDLVGGTGAVAVSVGASAALDAATVLQALDRYPYGCSEQIASRALPLLYVNELAADAHLAMDTALDERIRDAIDRVLARQGSNGSFGLWSSGGEDAWLDVYVTDFLTRAKEKGYAVPERAFGLALDRLRNAVANADDPAKGGGSELAYALYVLARNGVAPVGDLRYFADVKLDAFATPIARAQLAAALGMIGDKTRAERAYQSALAALSAQPVADAGGRSDYGSPLRDAAALVTLASEGNAPRPTITGAMQRVEAARTQAPGTSTQENAWLVLAARAMAKDAASVALTVDGQARSGSFVRTAKAADLAAPLRIANAGEGPVQAVVTVSGSPLVAEPPASQGFKIERRYFTLTGEPSDPAKAKQNQRFVVVLTITEDKPRRGQIMVADYLPAGFEIDNPNLVSSGDTGALDWIENGVEAAHTEFRDDRFTAAIARSASDGAVFTVAYVVRAVAPGHYVLPQASVEDMYNPARYARTATGTIDVQAAR